MTPAQAAEILAVHNAWRRHNSSSDDLPPMPMVDSLDLGKAIDVAVKALADQVAEAEPLTDEQVQAAATDAVKHGRLSWLGFKKDELGTYSIPVLSHSDFQFARAVEAAHGIKENPNG